MKTVSSEAYGTLAVVNKATGVLQKFASTHFGHSVIMQEKTARL